MDKLRTNHKGVFELQDHRFRSVLRISTVSPLLFFHTCVQNSMCVSLCFCILLKSMSLCTEYRFLSVSRGFLCCGVIILRFFWFWGNFCVCFLVFSYCADSSNLSMLQCIAVCCSVLQRIAACCRVCDITHLFARDQRK